MWALTYWLYSIRFLSHLAITRIQKVYGLKWPGTANNQNKWICSVMHVAVLPIFLYHYNRLVAWRHHSAACTNIAYLTTQSHLTNDHHPCCARWMNINLHYKHHHYTAIHNMLCFIIKLYIGYCMLLMASVHCNCNCLFNCFLYAIQKRHTYFIHPSVQFDSIRTHISSLIHLIEIMLCLTYHVIQ